MLLDEIFLNKIKVYAFVGPSGTGKSYRAQMVASEKNINYIIDDGLLIKDNEIVAGESAKKAPTKIETVKRALFINEEEKKTIEKADGSKVEEKRYYISSLLLNINEFSNAIRKHWNVENKLHWQMDFTFRSDDNTTKNKKALFNLQIIKKFCLTILNEVKKQKNKS